jgi:hypothetical protein
MVLCEKRIVGVERRWIAQGMNALDAGKAISQIQ